MKQHAVILLAAFAAFPAVGSAQGHPTQGERVRIAQRDGPTVIGTLDQLTGDHVRLFADGDRSPHAIPQSGIDRMERSLGRQRRFAKYFAIAVSSTTVAGGALVAATWSPCTPDGFMSCFMVPDSSGEAFLFGATLGAMVGVPVGILAGLAIREERWVPVPLTGSGEMSLSVRADGHNTGIGVSLRTARR